MFKGKNAIVTGGASGIGRSLVHALAQEGAHVTIADVDAEGAARVAGEVGAERAAAERLDVTDADAFGTLVERVAGERGSLDFLFNNAGIVVFGDARDMTLDDWNRQIDVNVRGVVHGIAAAYPIMIRQRSGHIVNTASAAGLSPAPSGTPYAGTKHFVVGVSESLRIEAARYGVRVSALCPGFIDTPIKYSAKILIEGNRDGLLEKFPFRLHSSDACARACLRGVRKNKAIIVFTTEAKIGWLLYRLSPSLFSKLMMLVGKKNPLLPPVE